MLQLLDLKIARELDNYYIAFKFNDVIKKLHFKSVLQDVCKIPHMIQRIYHIF